MDLRTHRYEFTSSSPMCVWTARFDSCIRNPFPRFVFVCVSDTSWGFEAEEGDGCRMDLWIVCDYIYLHISAMPLKIQVIRRYRYGWTLLHISLLSICSKEKKWNIKVQCECTKVAVHLHPLGKKRKKKGFMSLHLPETIRVKNVCLQTVYFLKARALRPSCA